MALIKKSDLKKMTQAEIKTKLNELKFELVKSKVPANKNSSKAKEIKRTIAKLLTLDNIHRRDKQTK